MNQDAPRRIHPRARGVVMTLEVSPEETVGYTILDLQRSRMDGYQLREAVDMLKTAAGSFALSARAAFDDPHSVKNLRAGGAIDW